MCSSIKRTPFLLRKLHLGMNGKIWICSLNYWRSERSQGHIHTLCILYKVPISFVGVNLEFMCSCFAYLISNHYKYDVQASNSYQNQKNIYIICCSDSQKDKVFIQRNRLLCSRILHRPFLSYVDTYLIPFSANWTFVNKVQVVTER